MKPQAPCYELRAVHEDGSCSEAQIIPITEVPWEASAGRRGFLGSGMSIASVLALATGCATKKPPHTQTRYDEAALREPPRNEPPPPPKRPPSRPVNAGAQPPPAKPTAAAPAPPAPKRPLKPSQKGDNVKVKVFNTQTNTWEFMTLPCGSPVPPGAICTCNCVPVTAAVPKVAPYTPPRTYSTGGGMICSCNQVCTCVPVYY